MKENEIEPTIIEAGVCQQAIGLFVNVDGDMAKIMAAVLSSPAEKKIEVLVKFGGESREFTFVDFFTRLGFAEVL
jgi:hypothetical protein